MCNYVGVIKNQGGMARKKQDIDIIQKRVSKNSMVLLNYK